MTTTTTTYAFPTSLLTNSGCMIEVATDEVIMNNQVVAAVDSDHPNVVLSLVDDNKGEHDNNPHDEYIHEMGQLQGTTWISLKANLQYPIALTFQLQVPVDEGLTGDVEFIAQTQTGETEPASNEQLYLSHFERGTCDHQQRMAGNARHGDVITLIMDAAPLTDDQMVRLWAGWATGHEQVRLTPEIHIQVVSQQPEPPKNEGGEQPQGGEQHKVEEALPKEEDNQPKVEETATEEQQEKSQEQQPAIKQEQEDNKPPEQENPPEHQETIPEQQNEKPEEQQPPAQKPQEQQQKSPPEQQQQQEKPPEEQNERPKENSPEQQQQQQQQGGDQAPPEQQNEQPREQQQQRQVQENQPEQPKDEQQQEKSRDEQEQPKDEQQQEQQQQEQPKDEQQQQQDQQEGNERLQQNEQRENEARAEEDQKRQQREQEEQQKQQREREEEERRQQALAKVEEDRRQQAAQRERDAIEAAAKTIDEELNEKEEEKMETESKKEHERSDHRIDRHHGNSNEEEAPKNLRKRARDSDHVKDKRPHYHTDGQGLYNQNKSPIVRREYQLLHRIRDKIQDVDGKALREHAKHHLTKFKDKTKELLKKPTQDLVVDSTRFVYGIAFFVGATLIMVKMCLYASRRTDKGRLDL